MESAKVWPRQPFIGLALAALVGILVADAWPHPAIGIALVVALSVVALLKRSSLATYAFAAAAFFLLHALHTIESPGARLTRQLASERLAIVARGTVVSEPRVSVRGVNSFEFRLREIERDGRTESTNAAILARWRGDVHYGDALQLFGVIGPMEPPRNPGEFHMRAYLARKDIHRVLTVAQPVKGKVLSRGGGSWIMRAALTSRAWMQDSLGKGLEDSPELQALINSMVLGAQSDTPEEIEEAFQQTGTLHLFAVSGLNVAIIAQLLWIVLSALRVPRRWAIALIIPALFFYSAVTGLNASSIRAALMAAALLGGFFFDRKLLSANSVAVAAVVVLCFDTNQLFSTGFQLSFAVVIAIFLLAGPLFRFFIRWCEPDPFLPKSLLNAMQRAWQNGWRALAGGAAVSLAAWFGSVPFILPYFYLITPISLFANLVVVPLAFFVLAFGLMSLLVFPLASFVALVFNNANWSLAAAILWIVGLFARAPAGHIYIERPHLPSGARVEMTVLDLGAGAAIHLRNGGADWLIDCGSESSFKRIVRGYLRSRGVNHINGLVLTHGDAAHIGGAPALARVFRPREIIDTPAPDRSRAHRALIVQELPRRFCTAAAKLDFGRDITARVLFPPNEFKANDADDQAMVLQLAIMNRWRVLLTSDSGEPTERALLDAGLGLKSDLLVKGQHRRANSATPEFLDAVQPQAIVASSLEFPENERIKDEWAASVAERGVKLLRQDETGAVRVRFFRDHWEAAPFLRNETFRSASR
jgi:ComEC/Rec2-related protein